MISLKNIINSHQSTLTKSELVICDYLLENSELIKNMTLLELSQKTYSSKTNVLRLLKKIGFSGFIDFKYYLLAQDTESESIPFLNLINKKIAAIDIDSISVKLNHLINEANNIFLFGTGQDQQIQAKNLKNYLLKSGIISTFIPLNINAELTNTVISSLTPDDLIIVFSSKGDNDLLKKYFKDLNQHNTQLVSFTTFKDGWIQKQSELSISLGIEQFQDPILTYQSGMMHLLLNIISTKIQINS